MEILPNGTKIIVGKLDYLCGKTQHIKIRTIIGHRTNSNGEIEYHTDIGLEDSGFEDCPDIIRELYLSDDDVDFMEFRKKAKDRML